MAKRNSLLTALAFPRSQRRYGKVLHPLKVAALDGHLLLAFGFMEWAQQRARKMPQEVKHLARTLAAVQMNCSWCLDFSLLESQKSERQLDELTFLIAWEQCVARFNRALGIEAHEVFGNRYCLVPFAR